MKKYWWLVVLSGWATGCTPLGDPSPDWSFRPEQGQAVIYNVTEEYYAANTPKREVKKQIKEVVVQKESDGSTDAYQIERYERTGTAGWQLTEILTQRFSPAEFVVLEGSLPFLKLIFPIQADTKWNALQYQAQSPKMATLTNFSKSFGSYPATYTVQYQNDSTLIDLRRDREVYAPGLGLVFREKTSLDYCQSSPACIGKGQVVFGSRIIWERVKP